MHHHKQDRYIKIKPALGHVNPTHCLPMASRRHFCLSLLRGKSGEGLVVTPAYPNTMAVVGYFLLFIYGMRVRSSSSEWG